MKKTPPVVTRAEGEVLATLAGGERFGLEVVEASGGRIKRGSVYVLLNRLEEKGAVASRLEARPGEEGGLPRRLYRLTAAGRRALEAWEAGLLALLGRSS